MSILSRLFGGGSAPEPEPETYKEFRIFAEPMKDAGGFRVSARIEKEVGGETLTHKLIRADVSNSEDEARELSTAKAKSLIDQMGERLFD